ASTFILISYGLLAIFLVAFVLRSVRLARLPIHLRWELSPVPHEKGKGHYGGSYLEEPEWWSKPMEKDMVSEGIYMFKEILFLKALFEHKRAMWLFSFPFHFGLYLLIGAGGLLVLGTVASLFGASVPQWGLLNTGLTLLAGIGHVLGVFGAVGLLAIRATEKGLRNSTSPLSFLNLLLLLAMFVTGAWMVFGGNGFSGQVLAFAGALVTADFSAQLPPVLLVHFLLAFLFLAYLPFTQMMHFVAKYFTYHDVRWDDKPMEVGSKMEKELQELMSQPVTWAAPHVRADGKKNWVDIAMDSGKPEETEK
ncbi:respiratory nitrate reductase subunit gamma, partial [Gemmatimonadota bacterium]